MATIYNIEQGLNNLRNSDKYWHSFIEHPNFEVGVLRLGVGEKDTQSPHKSDEIYLVLSGDGYLNIDGEDFKLKSNYSYFVPKNSPHYFHGNTEEITIFYVLN